MNELMPPSVAVGAFAMASAVLYAAWFEYRQKNHRDARFLAVMGVFSLSGSAFAWLN